MKTEIKVRNSKLTLVYGDITKQEIESIVNAANRGLLGGGGVDGAIHEAAGPSLLEECKKIRYEDLNGEWLPTGEAVITGSGNLPCKYVIHTVGPIWEINKEPKKLLIKAYTNSLILAKNNNIKSIAFPSISTGIFRFPIQSASKIALSAIINFLNHNQMDEVRMVLFSKEDYEIYLNNLKKLSS